MFDQSTVDSPRLESEEDSDQQSLKERLVSFDPPLLQDELFIKPHHVRAEGEINEYSAEIDCGSAPMHALIEERNELESICAASVSMCNSISHLVPDVLGEIFCFVREEASYSLSQAHSYVLPLAQTCRQWRSVAFSQPSLWAFIDLSKGYLLQMDSRYEERVTYAVQYHLDKSGEAPLSLRIGLSTTSPAYSALFAELYRWRECETVIMMELEEEQAFMAPYYPSLERLVFLQNRGVVYFERAPRLRAYHGPITEVRLPWAQLTWLTVTGGTTLHARHLMDTLNLCKDLEHLGLEHAIVGAPTAADTSLPAPVLHRLRVLRLLSTYERTAITELRILTLIDAPALDSFEICISLTDSRCESHALPDVVVGILTRFRALRILSLKGTPLDRHGLRRVLASAPSVERLVWWEIEELGHSNFAALADALSSSSLASDASSGADDHPTTDVVHTILPCLSHLEVSGGLTPADPRQIAGLIRSRAVKGDGPSDAATLRAVVLEYLSACNLEPRTLSELRRELDSFIIRENISQGRGVFSYQVEYEDEDPPYSISYFD